MRTVGAVAILLAALAVPAPAQAVRSVAVADFIDISIQGVAIDAPRLSGELARLLAERAGGRLRVIPVDRVRSAMAARGLRPEDLILPAVSAELAQALGAAWIVTGRWERLESDVDDRLREPDRFLPRIVTSLAVLNIRVLDAASRQRLLEESFWAEVTGGGFGGPLLATARTVLRQAAERIARL